MNLSRRDLLRGSLAFAAGTQWMPTGKLMAQEPVRAGIIDAHVHVWSRDTKAYPLGPGFELSDMQPTSFTPEQLFAHCKPVGVERVVLIQMNFYAYDHSYMFWCMDQHPGVFSAVGLIDHHADDIETKVDALAARGVRGIRLHSHGDAKDWPNDSGMARLWSKATTAGLAVCPLINAEELPFVDALVAKNLEATVVIDHFARIGINGVIEEDQLQQLCRLARYPGVHVKTSAFYALGAKRAPYKDLLPMIERLCDNFGPDRLMWASDCPFQVEGIHSYDASLALIRDHLELSYSEKQSILSGTAERVFFA